MKFESIVNGGTVTHSCQLNEINVHDIQHVVLAADKNKNPVVIVSDGSINDISRRVWTFPVTKGFEIHICNEFLRSLELDVDIHFKNYCQYGQLMFEISCLLEEKAETAQ